MILRGWAGCSLGWSGFPSCESLGTLGLILGFKAYFNNRGPLNEANYSYLWSQDRSICSDWGSSIGFKKHITKGFLANDDFHLTSFKSHKEHITLRSVQITLYKVSDHNPDHTPTFTIIFSLCFFLFYIALRSF